jgi:carboxymethylenebutenolidase
MVKRRDILIGASAIAVTTLAIDTQAKTPPKPINRGKTVQIAKDLPGYYVTPNSGSKSPTIIVLMEAFGVNQWCKNVCDRMAQSGFAALAPDFYRGKTYAYTDINGAIAQLKSLNDDAVMLDVGKSLNFLNTRAEIDRNGIGVMGFCMGGRYAFLTNATYPQQIKAAISCYGGGIDPLPNNPLGQKSLLPKVSKMQAPVMLIYGADDQLITAEEHARVTSALSQAKKRYILNLFPNAGHGFLSDRRENYSATAAAEAWMTMTGFLSYNLKPRNNK